MLLGREMCEHSPITIAQTNRNTAGLSAGLKPAKLWLRMSGQAARLEQVVPILPRRELRLPDRPLASANQQQTAPQQGKSGTPGWQEAMSLSRPFYFCGRSPPAPDGGVLLLVTSRTANCRFPRFRKWITRRFKFKLFIRALSTEASSVTAPLERPVRPNPRPLSK